MENLTREQLEQMPNPELDALVATKVMNASKSYPAHNYGENRNTWVWKLPDGSTLPKDWPPSTDWSAMGEVTKQLKKLGFGVTMAIMMSACRHNETCGAQVYHQDGNIRKIGWHETLPSAVAIASVLAVQEMKKGQ